MKKVLLLFVILTVIIPSIRAEDSNTCDYGIDINLFLKSYKEFCNTASRYSFPDFELDSYIVIDSLKIIKRG